MSGDYQFLDIILFALVAAFLILRLRSVLGRRNGHEGPTQDPFGTSSRREASDEKVVRLPERNDRPAEAGQSDLDNELIKDGSPLAAGLTQIKVADTSFDPNEFISGARIAFELILTAFANGDTATLKTLLSPEVFGNFSQSIRDREEAKQTMETTLVGISSTEIVEAYMAGRTAHLTMKFVSQQISVVRDENQEIVDGDPNTVTDVTDFWTFARDTRSNNPNWMLVATGSLD
jgi:predicted lipid-binding transport protein (Tim44 family)